MHDLAIFGAGGLGREVAFLIHQINQEKPQWNLIGYFDDRDLSGQTISSLPYLGDSETLNNHPSPLHVVLAIADPKAKQNLVYKLKNPLLQYPVLSHPLSMPLPEQNISIGKGSIICQGVILSIDITLGEHVLLNLASTIGHDAIISDYCSLMPGARLSGETILREGVYLGTNAVVLNRLLIGKFSTVGAGAVVIKSLPAKVTAVGVPAKIIKYRS